MNKIYTKVYGFIFIGLLISFFTGYFLSLNPLFFYNLILSNWFYFILILEIVIAIFFASRITKMNYITALICFILYCITTGFTLSVIFLAYELTSILIIFGITSLLFGGFAIYGYYTKKDISKIQSFLIMGLIGTILATIINIFINNSTLNIIISIIGIIIFVLFVAVDMKKIKEFVSELGENKGALFGAFQLYLDFINLFIRLIRIFGKSKN